MRNNAHFFGYNRLGSELTKGAKDLREQFDFGVDFETAWAPGKPDYLRLWGNAQVGTYIPISIAFGLMINVICGRIANVVAR